MEEGGFEYEPQRVIAADFRRYAYLPDFELDAELGIVEFAPEEFVPGPRPGASPAEAEAWHSSFQICTDEAERQRSEGFDQIMGKIPPWHETIKDINNSPEMADATARMLDCVADGGGPDVESIPAMYLAIDRILMESSADPEFGSAVAELPPLIASCAGDLNEIRQQLLIPERDRVVALYAEPIAAAESFFNDVVAQSGWDD